MRSKRETFGFPVKSMSEKEKIQTAIIVLQEKIIDELLYKQTPSQNITNKLNIIIELQQELNEF